MKLTRTFLISAASILLPILLPFCAQEVAGTSDASREASFAEDLDYDYSDDAAADGDDDALDGPSKFEDLLSQLESSAAEEAEAECGAVGPSKILGRLDRGEIDIGQLSDMEIAGYAAREEVLECLHIIENAAVLTRLLDRIPESMLIELITERPHVVDKMSEPALVAFAKAFPSIVAEMEERRVIEIANRAPAVVAKLPLELISVFARRADFFAGLSAEARETLLASEELAEKLGMLSREALVGFVTNNTDALKMLPTTMDYPARGVVERLMMDRALLEMIPARVHADLAASEFRHQLSPDSAALILSAHPGLPLILSDAGLEVNRRYMRNHTFLEKLPCAVFLHLAGNVTFLDKLDSADIRHLTRSRHMWNCLPVSLVRHVMREYGGARLGFRDLVAAAVTMPKHKALDVRVLGNVFKHQVPGMVSRGWRRSKGWP